MTFSKNFIAFGIILALFPYLKVPVANFDTAPYALIFFTLILLLRWNTVLFPKIFLVFLFPSLLGIMLVLPTLAGLDLLVFRSAMCYLSVILISFGTYALLYNNFDSAYLKKIICFIIFTWIFVGILQLLIDRDILTFLLNRSRTSSVRGVTSLSPEPSYFGTHLLFMFLLVVYLSSLQGKKIPKYVLLVVTLAIIFLSQSTTAILIMVTVFLLLIVGKLNLKTTPVFILLLGISVFISYSMLINLPGGSFRAVTLVQQFADNPSWFITVDGSVNIRLLHPIVSIYSSFQNNLLPMGYASFSQSFLEFENQFPDLVHPYTLRITGDRIFSGFGQSIFELGLTSFCFPLGFYLLLRRAEQTVLFSVTLTISVFLLMTTPITLNAPIFGFFIGLIAAKQNSLVKSI